MRTRLIGRTLGAASLQADSLLFHKYIRCKGVLMFSKLHEDKIFDKITVLRRFLFLIIATVILGLFNYQEGLAGAIIEHHEYSTADILDIADTAIEWKKAKLGLAREEALLSSEIVTEAGSAAIDWYALALGRLGYDDDYLAYLALAEANISHRYQDVDKLDRIKATEWHRVGMTMLSAGGDPTILQDGQINLVADGSYNRGLTKALEAQGSNAFYWGLLMIDSLRYEIPEDAVVNRNDIIFSILKGQQADGGFGQGGASSVDMTAMAIQALAPYYNNETKYKYIRAIDEVEYSKTVREIVDEALAYLSNVQELDGHFSNAMGGSCEDTAQVIMALAALGIDLKTDERFIKEGLTVIDALMSFRKESGGFAHLSNDDDADTMATEQALLALAAVARHEEYRRTIFDFRVELNDGIKDQLLLLDKAITSLSEEASVEEVMAVYQQYLLIPAEERSYVRAYHQLSQLMNDLKIINESESLVDMMNQNINGNGYILDLRNDEQIVIEQAFTSEDERKVKALPKKITMKNAHMVTILLRRLELAPNRQDYAEVEQVLTDKQEKAEALRAQSLSGEESKTNGTMIIVAVITINIIIIVVLIILIKKYLSGKRTAQKEKNNVK